MTHLSGSGSGSEYAQLVHQWGSIAWFLVYLANFRIVYVNAAPPVTALGPLWSLQVEEQFYLLWPWLFIFCFLPNFSVRRAMLILTAPFLIAPVCRVLSYEHWQPPVLGWITGYFSFLNFFDSLAVGCICAILVSRHFRLIQTILGQRFGLCMGLGFALILVPESLTDNYVLGVVTIPLGNLFQAWGFVLLLVQCVLFPHRSFYRVLNWSWICQLGVLSYSIYIWQQLFCTDPGVFGLPQVWWMSFPGWLVPVFVVSALSYYGLEKPLLRLRAHFRKSDTSTMS